jgi:hypothetical protein
MQTIFQIAINATKTQNMMSVHRFVIARNSTCARLAFVLISDGILRISESHAIVEN